MKPLHHPKAPNHWFSFPLKCFYWIMSNVTLSNSRDQYKREPCDQCCCIFCKIPVEDTAHHHFGLIFTWQVFLRLRTSKGFSSKKLLRSFSSVKNDDNRCVSFWNVVQVYQCLKTIEFYCSSTIITFPWFSGKHFLPFHLYSFWAPQL